MVPSRRRTQNASAALRIFARLPKKTFSISATNGLMRRSKQHLQSTIFDRAKARLREFELGVGFRKVPQAQKEQAGHFSDMFEKPELHLRHGMSGRKSPTIQGGIRRQAQFDNSIIDGRECRSDQDEDGEMR
jgi:hypothetical protein